MTTEPDPTNPDIAGAPTAEGANSAPPPPAALPAAPKRLTRSTKDDWFGGVAGGLAEYFDIDPTLVRIAFVAAAILSSGLAVVAYIVGWIVIPEGPTSDAAHAHKARRARSNTGAVVGGGLLILGGTLLLLSQLDLNINLPSWEVGLSVGLIFVGLLMLIEARRGFHGGLIALAVILVLLLGASSLSNFNFAVDGAFGESRHTVLRTDDLQRDYSHAFGSLTLDMRNLDLAPGTTRVKVSVAFGEATVHLPADIPYRIEADSVFGSIDADGFDTAGIASSRTFTSPGYDEADRRLDLTISTAFGSGRIR